VSGFVLHRLQITQRDRSHKERSGEDEHQFHDGDDACAHGTLSHKVLVGVNDTPDSHLYYYQNATWIWRGLKEQARCLRLAADEPSDKALAQEASQIATHPTNLRTDVERSLSLTLNARNPELKQQQHHADLRV
jgi:hypothetical protein